MIRVASPRYAGSINDSVRYGRTPRRQSPVNLEIETQPALRHLAANVMTVNEIATYFGIPKRRVYEMLRREAVAGFPCFRVGRGWRVDIDQMRDWMCQQAERKSPAPWLHIPPKERTQ